MNTIIEQLEPRFIIRMDVWDMLNLVARMTGFPARTIFAEDVRLSDIEKKFDCKIEAKWDDEAAIKIVHDEYVENAIAAIDLVFSKADDAVHFQMRWL